VVGSTKARENEAPGTRAAAGQPGPAAAGSRAGEAGAWAGLARAYRPDDAAAWDDLVARSVNGTILHTRRFLAYHGDRFRDRSLVVTKSNGKLAGVLPAAEDPADRSVVTSHPGLTYGGLVHDGTLYGAPLIEALAEVAAEYRAQGFGRLRYRAVPSIYHSSPAADDQYALSRLGADRYRRDLAAVINLAHRGRVWSGRKAWRKRAETAGVRTEENWDDIAGYWRILEENLAARHDATPTHSLAEIEYLHEQFPAEVVLLTAKLGGTLVAGNLFIIEGPVLQARYSATTSEGRKVSATDLVIEHGIALAAARGCQFYSMGTSTLDGGRQLNGSQYAFKVSFGSGGVIHETCELDLERVLDTPEIPG
jgi:Acetyltransferase (GNAT) domain